MGHIGKRIQERRKLLGITSQQVASYLGISRSYYTQLEQGTRYLKVIQVEKISDFLDTPVAEFFREDKPAGQPNPAIPIVADCPASPPLKWASECRSRCRSVQDLLPRSPITYAVRMTGTSMAPSVLEGDIVIVNPCQAPKGGDMVLARWGEGEWKLRYYRPGNGSARLIPENPEYGIETSDERGLELLGTVTLIVRQPPKAPDPSNMAMSEILRNPPLRGLIERQADIPERFVDALLKATGRVPRKLANDDPLQLAMWMLRIICEASPEHRGREPVQA